MARSASDRELNTPLTASIDCHPSCNSLLLITRLHSKPQFGQLDWGTSFFHWASKRTEACDDSKTKIRPIPPVLSQEEPQNRPPTQPWHLRHKESRGSSRTCRPIL